MILDISHLRPDPSSHGFGANAPDATGSMHSKKLVNSHARQGNLTNQWCTGILSSIHEYSTTVGVIAVTKTYG